MMLGIGSDSGGPVWTAAKWLEVAPIGTVVRNGCTTTEPHPSGVYMKKIHSVRASQGYEWAWCNHDGSHESTLPDYEIRSTDLYLPVQVVKLGEKE